MAVPSSGTLSMLGIRREIGDNNYSASTSYTNISLEDMSEGTNGAINTNNAVADRPDGTDPHAMSEFYNYDHDKAASGTGTLYYGSDCGLDGFDACISGTGGTYYWTGSGDPISNGYAIYTNSAKTTKAPSGCYASYIGGIEGVYEYWDNTLGAWGGSGSTCPQV